MKGGLSEYFGMASAANPICPFHFLVPVEAFFLKPAVIRKAVSERSVNRLPVNNPIVSCPLVHAHAHSFAASP